MDTRELTGKTKLLCLLGDPVTHSLSPLLQNTAFHQLELDYVYLCFPVTAPSLPQALEAMRACSIRGCNLTMPLKNAVVPYLDALSPIAALVGAVNTIVQEEGKLTGHNTDGIGLLRALKETGTTVQGRSIVLLGAGGAASAILAQAALDGAASVHVFTRQNSPFRARAEGICEKLRPSTHCTFSLSDLEDTATLRQALSSATVLINGTSVGMEPHANTSLIPDAAWLHPDLVVADVVYSPRKTRLLTMAEDAGCTICPGLEMLLWQAAASFRLWTGREMPMDAVRSALLAFENRPA